MFNVNKSRFYYIVKWTIENQTELQSAFLAGSLGAWREAFEDFQAPTNLLLTHEALLAFTAETIADDDDPTVVCAKRYASFLTSMRAPNDITIQVLIEWHKTLFDNPSGYRFKPGELKSKEVSIQLIELLGELNQEWVDPFTNMHLIYTAFIKLSPFHAGNEIMANALLHLMLMHFKLTTTPSLLLSKFVPVQVDLTYDNFLQGLLEAQEHLQSIYQSVRILQKQYRDRVMTLETRPKKLANDLLSFFLERKSFTVREIESAYGKKYKITYHTLNKLMTQLAEDLHLLEIISWGERNRMFSLKGYRKLFT